MFNDYKSYYFDGLVPAYKDYITASKRRQGGTMHLRTPAMSAANMLFHFRDYLKPVLGEHFSRDYVGNLSYEYDLVGDVFNMSKHKNLLRKNKLIRDTQAIKEMIVSSVIPNVQNTDWYWYNEFRIIIFPIKGYPIDLLKLCTLTLNFWSGFLLENKLVEQAYFATYLGDTPLSEQEAEGMVNINMDVGRTTVGSDVAFTQRLYDHTLKAFVPFTGQFGLMKDGIVIPPTQSFQPK